MTAYQCRCGAKVDVPAEQEGRLTNCPKCRNEFFAPSSKRAIDDTCAEIELYIKAGYPLLYIVSHEEKRVTAALQRVAQRLNRQVRVWTSTKGFGGKKEDGVPTQVATAALDAVASGPAGTIAVLLDFHTFLREDVDGSYVVIRKMRDVIGAIGGNERTLVILAPNLVLPSELEKAATVIEFPTPDYNELFDHVKKTIIPRLSQEIVTDSGGGGGDELRMQGIQVKLTDREIDEIVRSLQGLTLEEAEHAIRKSAFKDNRLDAHDLSNILAEKGQIVKKSGALEFYPPQETLDHVGGLDALKEWLRVKRRAFTTEARAAGVDAPRGLLLIGVPGCGKCVVQDTYLFTTRGMVKIGELVDDYPKPDQTSPLSDLGVRSETGRENVALFYNGGVKPCRRIITRHGYEVTGTFNHPVRVLRDGSPAWVRLGGIRAGDRVAVMRSGALFADRPAPLPAVPDVRRGNLRDHSSIPIRAPERMSEALAEWLGWIVSEGCVTIKKTTLFSNLDQRVVRRMARLTRQILGLRMKCGTRTHSINSVALKRWLSALGVRGLSHEKTVPDSVLRSPGSIQRAFLRALFEGDASIEPSARRIEFSTASHELARQVHLMLLNLGIVGTLYAKTVVTRRWGARVYRRLTIVGDQAIAFGHLVGFMGGGRKQRALDALRPAGSGWDTNGLPTDFVARRYRSIRRHLEATGVSFDRTFWQEAHTVHRAFVGRGRPSESGQTLVAARLVRRGLELFRKAEECDAWKELAEQVYRGILWDEVTSIEAAGQRQVVDVTVPGSHSFVGNGIVCHNSLTAKAISSFWQLPLLRFDVGRVFSKWIGASEENMRGAIRLSESLAPAILWIDEIEKGFSGLGASDSVDAGVTARVLSTFLTWMQEKRQTVFVVATANQVRRLPPEFLRKGRFDEIFYVDLPTREERREIATIHVAKRKKDPTRFDIDKIAQAAEGFTGADIEAAIKEAVEQAFADGKECSTELVLDVMKSTVPLSVTMREDIAFLRQWQEGRARPASSRRP